mgnify:CR=1 FL=1|tara:strand:- start:1109 stop:2053 length:945 start_codon:yes stop_codon:yes gene_type:complete
MIDNQDQKRVAIILGFYNGNKYLIDQLDSIISQTHNSKQIFIFNDNSSEKINLLNSYQNKKSNSIITTINRKKNLGFAGNFLFGLRDVGSNFDYYAFSDQDDIWEINKIEKALNQISKLDTFKPVLYCSRTAYYTEDCSKEIGESKYFKNKKGFKNALIQNIAAGNTIVLNRSARDLVVESLICDKYISHDWWCYQLITAAGGEVIYDKKKSVRYRQHRQNLIGGNNRFRDKLQRLNSFISGIFKSWIDVNISNLNNNRNLIKRDNLEILDNFIKARDAKNPFKRLRFYFKAGAFRQSFIENFVFIFGIFFNKI